MDHEKAIEAAKQAALKLGIVANDDEMRVILAAFLRAVETSDSVTAAGFAIHPCHSGETKVSDSMRAMCRALAEEII